MVTDGRSFAVSGAEPRRRPQTAAEYVSASLRKAILNGELEGGTRLGLAEVAAAFEVSATPVREALRELSFEGLVQFDPYRGGMVNAVTEADVREIVRLRQVLEPIAMREAVDHLTADVVDEADAVLAGMDPGSAWEEWIEGNRRFHVVLYSASPSRRLRSMIKSLQDPTVVFVSSTLRRQPDLRTRADREHRAILAAMQAGDADTAIALTLEHLAIPLRGDDPPAPPTRDRS